MLNVDQSNIENEYVRSTDEQQMPVYCIFNNLPVISENDELYRDSNQEACDNHTAKQYPVITIQRAEN